MEIDSEEVTTPLVFEAVHAMDSIRIPGAARRLLDALARMHDRGTLSLNVRDAENELRTLIEYHESRGRSIPSTPTQPNG